MSRHVAFGCRGSAPVAFRCHGICVLVEQASGTSQQIRKEWKSSHSPVGPLPLGLSNFPRFCGFARFGDSPGFDCSPGVDGFARLIFITFA